MIRAAVIYKKDVERGREVLLEKRHDRCANDIRFVSCRDNNRNPFARRPRRTNNSEMLRNAPKATSKAQQINPDQERNDSERGYEHNLVFSELSGRLLLRHAMQRSQAKC